jgi:hypothetical protein
VAQGLACAFNNMVLKPNKMKNEKNKPEERDQLRNQQQGTQIEQQQKLKKEQRSSRESDELENSDFESELEEGDDVEQGRAGDKFGKQKGRQQDPTKSQQSRQKDEYQGGTGKGIDVD